VGSGGFGGGIDVRVAVPDDAPAIRSVQARTWLATYPNPELGITREGLRRYLEGEDGERIAERIARIRQRLAAHANDPAGGCDFVAVLDGEIVGFTAPFVTPGGRRRVGALYVLPSFHGSGVGHRLLTRNLAWHGADVQIGEVMALLISTCQGALQGAWSDELQRRALAVIFDGLSAAPRTYRETHQPQDRGGSGFCG
jgi:GNAT superfamily N-acetyltransferase